MVKLNVEYDTETGQISCQFPDIWIGVYPKGCRDVDGKDKFYNGACLVRRGTEHIHLNAFDIVDVLRFLEDERVKEVMSRLNDEHVMTNLFRTALLYGGVK